MEELDQVLNMLGMQSSDEEEDDDSDEYDYEDDASRPITNNNGGGQPYRPQQFPERPPQAQAPKRHRGPDPMYESWEQGGALDEQWPFKLPPNRMRNQTTESLDLGKMLKALNVAPSDTMVQSAVQHLSSLIKEARVQLREQSRRCDIELYWTYLMALKRLNRYFDNADCAFEAYFPGCAINRSPQFVYEYMQMLLLTATRLAEQALGKEVPTAQSAKEMELVKFLLEDLKKCVEYCLSDKLMQNGKWFYQPALEAMGSNLATQQQRQQSVVQAMHHDRQQLHRFIQHDLHGLVGVELRCLLCGTKMIELCLGVLQEKLDTLPDAGARCEKVYEKVVPLMLTVQQNYNEIVVSLGQHVISSSHGQHGGAQCTLFRYAQYQSYAWYLKAELAMAEAEWACYGSDSALDIELYGKRAIKRLRVLIESIGVKEQWFLSLRPGIAMKRKWDATKKRVTQLHDDVRREVIDSVWRTASACSIPDMRPHRPEQDDRSLTSVFAEKWERLLSDQRYRCLVVVLEYLDYAFTAGSNLADGQQQQYTTTGNNNNGSVVLHQVTQQNQYTLGLINDRKKHLDWLVSMISPTSNTITIGSGGCDYLRNQQLELEEFIAVNNIAIDDKKS